VVCAPAFSGLSTLLKQRLIGRLAAVMVSPRIEVESTIASEGVKKIGTATYISVLGGRRFCSIVLASCAFTPPARAQSGKAVDIAANINTHTARE
jgi:hypothetical protein